MKLREKMYNSQLIQAARELADIKKRIKNGLYPSSFSMPLAIQFEVTAKCNLYCKHCYNKSSMKRESPMSVADWKSVVKDIVEHGGIFQCIISGGEPLLLGDDLFEIMCPLSEDGTAFVLITNGYLVNEQLVKRLKQFDYFWVQVSIDHLLPEKHDAFRGRSGSWIKAVNAAFLLASAGLPLRIAHSMTPESIDYLPEFVELCYQLGASTIICGEIMLSGRAASNREVLFSERDYDKFYNMLIDLNKHYDNKINIATSAREEIQINSKIKRPNESILIRPNGDVRLDCIAPFVIGNVLQDHFSKIWREKGTDAWKNIKIAEYAYDLCKNGYAIQHINHLNPDIQI